MNESTIDINPGFSFFVIHKQTTPSDKSLTIVVVV